MAKPSLIRSFIAINPDPALQKALTGITSALQLQPQSNQVKWIKPENFHLTLRFLGEITADKIAEITAVLALTLKNMDAFTIETGKIILFPPEYPHILAQAITITPALANAVQTIEKTVNQCGIVPEARAFLPHLTLGRLKKDYKLDLTNVPVATIPKKFSAPEIIFYQSELTEKGSVYTPLQHFKLNPTVPNTAG